MTLSKFKKVLCASLLTTGIIASNFSQLNIFASGVLTTDQTNPPITSVQSLSPEEIVREYYDKDKEFKVFDTFINSTGATVVKVIQTFNGVPIYGTDQNYHIYGDRVNLVAGVNVDDIENKIGSSNNQAQFPEQDVQNVIKQHLTYEPENLKFNNIETILYPVNNKYYYVYKFEVSFGSPRKYTCYVDVNNLSLLHAAPMFLGDPRFPKGDLNGDEEINAADMLLLKKIILRIPIYFVTIDLEAADVNNDNRINVLDYTLMRKYILEVISHF
jgi:Zn-dependent metalloprotease